MRAVEWAVQSLDAPAEATAMTAQMIVNSTESLQRMIGTLRTQWQEHKYLRVTVKIGKHRSLDANAVTHVWYGQIARESGDLTEAEVKAFCKLNYGVPILRSEDEEFREQYNRLILHRYTYAEKLEMMRMLPVTSLMTTDQMNRYRDTMQREYAKQGVILEYKDELKEAA